MGISFLTARSVQCYMTLVVAYMSLLLQMRGFYITVLQYGEMRCKSRCSD